MRLGIPWPQEGMITRRTLIAIGAAGICLAAAAPAWATFPGADGRILFQRSVANSGLFTMAPDGSDVRKLEPRLAFSPEADPWNASWSANGRWIVYTCYQVYVQVCRMRPDGSNARLITPGGDPVAEPSFSPGGGRVIFYRLAMRTDPGGLFMINTDGSHEHHLLRDAYGAAWAPDGKHIVYDSYPGIWLMRPNGVDRRLLYSGGGNPRYTPSGSILFDANNAVMRMGPFGGNPHPISTDLGQIQVAPAGGCMVGMDSGAPHTFDLYARGGRCPATGLLVKNGEDPSWQPLPQPGSPPRPRTG